MAPMGALMAAPLVGVAKVALTMFSEDDDRIDDLSPRRRRSSGPTGVAASRPRHAVVLSALATE
jgi:hypothetical protein